VRAAEETIARLEGAEDSVLHSSGMAAIANALLSQVGSGDEIVCAYNTYGGTHHLLADVLPRYGVSTRFVAVEGLREGLGERTRAVYFEPVTNPTLRVVDVAPIVEACQRRGIAVVVDNTVASPVFLRPLALGVDLVVHSATKYMGGHSDLLAGVVSGSRARLEAVRTLTRYLGNCFNPREAALLLRGLKTLPLRVRHQDASARAVAAWLATRPEVRRVWHPSLPSHPDHGLATRLLEGTGCLVSFDLADGAAARRCVDALSIFQRAASLGGVESLVTIPVLSSHWNVGEESLRAAGVTAATIRLSIGVEDVDDLIADLERGLTA
jgi:cystathionine beta-lyase/cystathionine gamma-synthase